MILDLEPVRVTGFPFLMLTGLRVRGASKSEIDKDRTDHAKENAKDQVLHIKQGE
jgi:hypothetical protein